MILFSSAIAAAAAPFTALMLAAYASLAVTPRASPGALGWMPSEITFTLSACLVTIGGAAGSARELRN